MCRKYSPTQERVSKYSPQRSHSFLDTQPFSPASTCRSAARIQHSRSINSSSRGVEGQVDSLCEPDIVEGLALRSLGLNELEAVFVEADQVNKPGLRRL